MPVKRLFLLLSLLTLLQFGFAQPKTKEIAKPVPVVDFQGLKPFLSKDNDTVYVVNFWATWCAPCVVELPYFENINQEFGSGKVKVLLVSLDFPNHYDTRLIPFISGKNIQSSVVMLDDPNSNFWINEVDASWSGAIPATLIYKGNNRRFFEKVMTTEELKSNILSLLSK